MHSRFAVPLLASLVLACSTETASSFKKSDGGTTNDAGFEEPVDSGLDIPQGDGGTIASNTPPTGPWSSLEPLSICRRRCRPTNRAAPCATPAST